MKDKVTEFEEAKGTIETIDDGSPDDLFFVAAGFESRALSGIETLSENYQAKNGLIYVNKEYFDSPSTSKTVENLEKIEEKLKKHCDSVDVIKGSWLNPIEQLYALRRGIDDLESENGLQVTVDITTFNREALFVGLHILYSQFSNVETRTLYVSAEEHGEWLSKGHRSIRNMMGFGGIQNSAKPTLLIILSGFESDRTINTIEEFEPAKVLLGIGDPPTSESFLDQNIQSQEMALSRQETEKFQFPANEIDGTEEVLDKIVNEHLPDWNVVISPMSTKLSTLGSWRTARKHKEVQITYTIPGEYNLEDYSSGSDKLYINWL